MTQETKYTCHSQLRYMSGQQALDMGVITEAQWRQAIRWPWTWVILSSTLRVREIPWQGLEVEKS